MWNSKPKKSGCNCRKRTHGNPKIACGICEMGVRPAVDVRIAGKRVERLWLVAAREGRVEDVDL